MSVLTDFWNSIVRTSTKVVNRMVKGKMTETYNLNSDNQMNVAKARAMFHNTDNEYKLAAGLIKPIINADVSFIGEPVFHSIDERTNEVLKEINKKQVGYYQAAHKVSLREGDFYIWIQWDVLTQSTKWVGLPDDKLDEIIRDPITNEAIQYVFKWNIDYKDKMLVGKRMEVQILIDKEIIVYKYTGQIPAGIQSGSSPNVLKELPIVQLSNEREDFEQKGHSEITAIEPFLKAYHDVFMMALQSQKNNSAPKLKLKVKNVQEFVDNNWGSNAWSNYKAGTRPEGFSVENLDLVFLADDDDSEYMSVQSTTGSAEPLLKLLFSLIVETSETIEVVFGANLGTSLASVESQLPVYVKKIERKQRQFQPAWEKVVELDLKFKGFVNIESLSNEIEVEWKEVDFESKKDKATRLKTMVSAHVEALKSNQLSFEEVHAENKPLFKNIVKEYKEHAAQVAITAALIKRFQEDSFSQEIGIEEDISDQEVNTMLEEMDAGNMSKESIVQALITVGLDIDKAEQTADDILGGTPAAQSLKKNLNGGLKKIKSLSVINN